MPPASKGRLPPSYLYRGQFSKTRFLSAVMDRYPSARTPKDILEKAQPLLPASVRDAVSLTDMDVHNTRTWRRAQRRKSCQTQGHAPPHPVYGPRASILCLVAVAMGKAGGPTADPDRVLEVALGCFHDLPKRQRPRRKPERSDVVNTLNEFKHGRLQSLLPLAGMVSGLEDPVTPAERQAAEQFVAACAGSADRAQAVLRAYAAFRS